MRQNEVEYKSVMSWTLPGGGKLRSLCVCILQRTGNPLSWLVCTISEATLWFDSSIIFFTVYCLNRCGMNYVTSEKWTFVEINSCHHPEGHLPFWGFYFKFFCVVIRWCCTSLAECPQRRGGWERNTRGWFHASTGAGVGSIFFDILCYSGLSSGEQNCTSTVRR